MMYQMALDPMHQFEIVEWIPFEIGGIDLSFTNASFFMLLAVALIVGFFMFALSKPSVIPNKMQSVGEVGYEFIANMIRDTIGEEGFKFFPLVFSLFMFVFAANMLGMVPFFYTTTSQVIVTATLALLVFFTVIIFGVMKNGLKFFKLFAPSGVPWPLLILLVPLEIISFFVRPVTLSLRLFGNILAGHIVLKLFVGFGVAMLSAGLAATIFWLPLVMAIALTALEFLVAFLQAYIFAILTCIYLNDAFHPSH
tara:strand:- start:62941 stop:63699 length:759 start_codon:yes stop_codon:yes gene_type:complete